MAAISIKAKSLTHRLANGVGAYICENVEYFANVEPSSSEQRERLMKRFIESEDQSQSTLLPEHLDDYIADDNPVRVIDVFVDELDLKDLGACASAMLE
jgi:hypothetical protein